MIRRYAVFVIFLALGLILTVSLNRAPLLAESTEGEDHPSSEIKFSHKLHIGEFGIECATCHPAVQSSKLSTDNLIGGHDQCITCHEEQIANTCGYCHTDPDNIEEVSPRTSDLYFSHEQHLGIEAVECKTCHAGIETLETANITLLPSMQTCYGCHNDRQATNTCEACHKDFVTLLPTDHKMSDFLHSHRQVGRVGGLAMDCQTCHKPTFCQQCHVDPELKGFVSGKDLMTEPDAKTSTKDSPEQMRLQFVHELNFRFTHGVDAKAKQMECESCHDRETFCAECHRAGGNISQDLFKPASHSVAGFVILGMGSGGGLHAEEARRDIESCVSCHDVEGRDPVCMTCHTATGGLR